jgi:hypothetical protein
MFIKRSKVEIQTAEGDQSVHDDAAREGIKKAAQDITKKAVDKAEEEVEKYKKMTQGLES